MAIIQDLSRRMFSYAVDVIFRDMRPAQKSVIVITAAFLYPFGKLADQLRAIQDFDPNLLQRFDVCPIAVQIVRPERHL